MVKKTLYERMAELHCMGYRSIYAGSKIVRMRNDRGDQWKFERLGDKILKSIFTKASK